VRKREESDGLVERETFKKKALHASALRCCSEATAASRRRREVVSLKRLIRSFRWLPIAREEMDDTGLAARCWAVGLLVCSCVASFREESEAKRSRSSPCRSKDQRGIWGLVLKQFCEVLLEGCRLLFLAEDLDITTY
jgi:hypothetical protein